jgi:hypothetical protein
MPPFKEGSPSVPQQASAQETNANHEVLQGEDTRWDINKAETVGRATYQDAKSKRRYDSDPFDFFPIELPSIPDEKPKGYHEAQEWRDTKEKIERLQTKGREGNTMIAELQQPYEKLYDLDPQRFSQTSLSEFMSLAQEFSGLEWRLSEAQEMVDDMKDLSSLLEKHVEQKRRFDGDFWRYLINTVKYNKGFPEEESVFLTQEEIYDIVRDFDNSPRQVIQKYKQIVERFIPVAETYLEQKKKDYEEFLAKHGLSDSVQEAPTA